MREVLYTSKKIEKTPSLEDSRPSIGFFRFLMIHALPNYGRIMQGIIPAHAYALGQMGIHPHDVASIMDMDGVCIRAGHHCAQPLLTWLGVENLACCRASVAFYNDKADIDKFIAGLHHVWSTFNE